MKASGMSNEELAKELDCAAELYEEHDEEEEHEEHAILREAAERLRKIKSESELLVSQTCDMTISRMKEEIVKVMSVKRDEEILENVAIRRRLKMADDAIRELRDLLVAGLYDGKIDPCEALDIAEKALAAISDGGGAK